MILPSGARGPAAGADLADALDGTLTEVEAALEELMTLTRRPAMPESSLLGAARLRFSRSLGVNLKCLRERVLPLLAASGSERARDAASAADRELNDYFQAAAHHVAAWPSGKVAADWRGYVQSATAMFARLRTLLDTERTRIRPLLVQATTSGRSGK